MTNVSGIGARAPEPTAATSPTAAWMLMVEHHLVSRRTIATVVHELGMARVEEAGDAHAAARRLQDMRYAALLIDLGQDHDATLELIARVREGHTACDARMPVITMSPSPDAPTLKRLNVLGTHLLVRPFKVRTLLELLRGFETNGGGSSCRPIRR